MAHLMSLIVVMMLATSSRAFSFVSAVPSQQKKAVYLDGHLGQKVVREHKLLTKNYLHFGKLNAAAPFFKKFSTISSVLFSHLKNINVSGRPNANQLVDMAFSYLEKNRMHFNTKDIVYAFDENSLVLNSDFQSLNLLLYRSGVLVEDAYVSFQFKQGKIIQILDASFSQMIAAQPSDLISISAGKELIRDILGGDDITFQRRLYRVPLAASANGEYLLPILEFQALINAVTYKIQVNTEDFSIYQAVPEYHTLFRGKVSAKLYKKSYLDTPEFMPLKELMVEKGSYSDQLGNFSIVSQPSSKISLNGRRVQIADKSGSPVTFAISENSDKSWSIKYNDISLVKSNDRQMAQIMAYYHATEIHALAQSYLPNLSWLKSSVPVNVNIKVSAYGSCNAYWDGSSLNFFTGLNSCANTALLSDVIYHEWGHGLDHNTGGISDAAFSEGFGDIMAMVMNRSADLGIGFYTYNMNASRELETNKIYPTHRSYDPHKEGLIIASTFWDLYKELVNVYGENIGHELLTKFAFLMISSAKKYTDVYNVLLAIDDDDGNLANGTPNMCLINKVFTLHGLAKALSSC